MTTAQLPDKLRSLEPWRPVIAALEREYGVFVVGGAVRDVYLDRTPTELDFVVEGDGIAVGRELAAALAGDITIHSRFGTATVRAQGLTFDVATTRTEEYPRPGALPEVKLGASISEDLQRRDFSVNTLAWSIADDRIISAEGAMADLELRQLRVLHDQSFLDDPTRLLRLVRYAARLGFDVEAKTDQLARRAVSAGALKTVSGDRMGNELVALLREPQPAALRLFAEYGLAAELIDDAVAVDEARLRAALELAPSDARNDLVALAVVCVSVSPENLHHALDELGFRAHDRDLVVRSAINAQPIADLLERLDISLPREIWLGLHHYSVEELATAGALSGAQGRAVAALWFRELRHVELAIDGSDIVKAGLSGPDVGRALRGAMIALLDDRKLDRAGQLEAALAAVRS